MKFTKKLSTHLTPEWRKQYINYEELKDMILKALDGAPVVDETNKHMINSHYIRMDESFFQECENELTKINNFYAEKLAEAKRKFLNLKNELYKSLTGQDPHKSAFDIPMPSNRLSKRRLQHHRLAFSEFYLSLVLLQNYQSLNFTGFRKILKKHDKILQTNSGAIWFNENVDNAFFSTNKDILKIIHDTETAFIVYLEGGDRARAMKRLRVPPLAEVHQPWCTFFLGLHSGAMLVMCIVAYFAFSANHVSSEVQIACVRLFRGPFLVILFLFLIGINIHGWRVSGVNHVLIFELDPRQNLTGVYVMQMATGFGALWALCVLGFLYHAEINVSPYVFPPILVTTMVLFLVNPFRVCHYTSRVWLLHLTGRVVTAPFHHVGFADFWLGDQMNSLIVPFLDHWYILYFYMKNWAWSSNDNFNHTFDNYIFSPLVACLPAWFRFAQCLRRYRDNGRAVLFLLNAGKYSTTFVVVIFAILMRLYRNDYASTYHNPFVWGYLVSYTLSTVYCYAWDMLRDFRVFTKFSGENIFLREEIIYSASFYYFGIIEDFLLRFLWVPAFFLTHTSLIDPYNMRTVTGTAEIFRRYIWNYFRLENEHLFNSGQFRAVRDISIGPIEPKEQITLQRMMDEADGVKNRRSRPLSDQSDKDKDD